MKHNGYIDSPKTDVSIITINWNTGELLERCLTSIVQNTADIAYEIIVIDNNSKDDSFERTKDKLSAHGNIKWIKNYENLGCISYNRALLYCRGRYFLIIGPDTVFFPQAIERMVEFLDNNKDAGAVTAKLLNQDRSPQNYYYRFWNLPMFFFNTKAGQTFDKMIFKGRFVRRYFGGDIDPSKVTVVDQPALVCLMFRRDAITEDYIIDDDFPFFFPDSDLCKRIYDNGYKIYLLPVAEVIHFQSYSYKQADEDWKQREFRAGAIRYFKKYHRKKVLPLRVILFLNGIAFLIFKRLPGSWSRRLRLFYLRRVNAWEDDQF